MMKPISTFGQTSLRNAQLRRLEGDLATANNELSTGKKDDVAKSIGSDLIRLQTIRNQFEANETYLRSVNLYKQRYDIMEGAFAEVESAVQDLVVIEFRGTGHHIQELAKVTSAILSSLHRPEGEP